MRQRPEKGLASREGRANGRLRTKPARGRAGKPRNTPEQAGRGWGGDENGGVGLGGSERGVGGPLTTDRDDRRQEQATGKRH